MKEIRNLKIKYIESRYGRVEYYLRPQNLALLDEDEYEMETREVWDLFHKFIISYEKPVFTWHETYEENSFVVFVGQDSIARVADAGIAGGCWDLGFYLEYKKKIKGYDLKFIDYLMFNNRFSDSQDKVITDLTEKEISEIKSYLGIKE